MAVLFCALMKHNYSSITPPRFLSQFSQLSDRILRIYCLSLSILARLPSSFSQVIRNIELLQEEINFCRINGGAICVILQDFELFIQQGCGESV